MSECLCLQIDIVASCSKEKLFHIWIDHFVQKREQRVLPSKILDISLKISTVPKNNFRPKFFWTQNSFRANILFDQKFFGAKNIFGHKIFPDPKLFFFTHKFLGAQILLDSFFWTQYIFGLGDFVVTKDLRI